jgi:plasmid maintenance system killer protein
MKYEFSPSKLKEKYEDEKYMKKKYGLAISEGMLMFLGALEAAENAYDIKSNLFFYMEHKKGNLKDYYSISLDKKKSKWRLLIQMIDENDNILQPTDNEKMFLKSVKKIKIKEISEHYGEY